MPYTPHVCIRSCCRCPVKAFRQESWMFGAQVTSVEQRDGSEGQSAQTSHPPPPKKRRKKIARKKGGSAAARSSGLEPTYDNWTPKNKIKSTYKNKATYRTLLFNNKTKPQSASFWSHRTLPSLTPASGVRVRFDLSGSRDFTFFLL